MTGLGNASVTRGELGQWRRLIPKTVKVKIRQNYDKNSGRTADEI